VRRQLALFLSIVVASSYWVSFSTRVAVASAHLPATANSTAAVPVGLPVSGQPVPRPPGGHAYQRTQRSPSDLYLAQSRQAPDFGSRDQILPAWRAGRLSADQMVQYGLRSIVNPLSVPSQWRPSAPLGDLAGLYFRYIPSQAGNASAPTQNWVKTWGAPRGQSVASPTAAPTLGPTSSSSASAPATSSSAEPTAASATGSGVAFRPAAPAVSTMTTADDCNTPVGGFLIFDLSFLCVRRTAHVAIYYSTDDVGVISKVDPTDADGNGTFDYIDALVQGAESAYATYSAMGYQIANPTTPVTILVGVDSLKSGVTLPFPFGGPYGQGNAAILLRSNFTNANYVVRHEMFHAFQYYYLPLDQLLPNLGEVNWWMESTAEWAAHLSYLADPTGEARYSDQADDYARNLPYFLGDPGLTLNEVISTRNVLVLELGEDECGLSDVGDLVGAGRDVLEYCPAGLQQGEASLAEGT
jgi:hypothetical protein